MDTGEYLKGLDTRTISLATQAGAQALLTEFHSSTHIDRAKESGKPFIRALGKDLLELTTAPMRLRSYKLHRQIGLSTFEALRHSSPAEGLATATLIVPTQNR